MLRALIATLYLAHVAQSLCLNPSILSDLGLDCSETPTTDPSKFEIASEVYQENGGACCTGVKDAFTKIKIQLTKDQREAMSTTMKYMVSYKDLLKDVQENLKGIRTESGSAEREIEEKILRIQKELRSQEGRKKSKSETLYFYLTELVEELMKLTRDEMVVDEKTKHDEWVDLRDEFDVRDGEKTHDQVMADLNDHNFDSKDKIKAGIDVLKDMIRQEIRKLQALENKLKFAMKENTEIQELIEKQGGVKSEDGKSYVFPGTADIEKSDLDQFGLKDDEGKDVDVNARPSKPQGDSKRPVNGGGKPEGTQDGKRPAAGDDQKKPSRPEGEGEKPAGDNAKKPPQGEEGEKPSGDNAKKPPSTDGQKPSGDETKKPTTGGGQKPAGGGGPKPPGGGTGSKPRPRLLQEDSTQTVVPTSELFHDLLELEQEVEESKDKLEEMEQMKEELEGKEREDIEQEIKQNLDDRVENSDNIINQMFAWTENIKMAVRGKELISGDVARAKELLPPVFQDLKELLDMFLKLESFAMVEVELKEDFQKYTFGENKGDKKKGNRAEDDRNKEGNWKEMVENVKSKNNPRKLEEAATEGTEADDGNISISEELAVLHKAWDETKGLFDSLKEKIKTNLDVVQNLLVDVAEALVASQESEVNKALRVQDADDNLAQIEELRLKLVGDIQKEQEILNDETKTNEERIAALKHTFAFNKIWEEIKPFKEQLAELKTKIQNGEDSQNLSEVLKDVILRPIKLNILEVVEMDLMVDLWDLHREMGAQNEPELESQLKSIEEVEVLLEDMDLLSQNLKDSGSRNKCYKAQFKAMMGVVVGLTTGNATDLSKFTTAGEFSAVAVDSNAAEEVMSPCWDVVYTQAVTQNISFQISKFSESVDSEEAHQGQVSQEISKIYNCMLGNESCNKDFVDTAFQEFIRPLNNGMKKGKDPSKMKDTLNKLKDKRTKIKKDNEFAQKEFDDFYSNEDKKDHLDIDDKGHVDVSKDHDKPFGPDHPEDAPIPTDVNIDEDLTAPVQEARILEASGTNDVSYSVDTSVKVDVMSVGQKSGLDPSPVEDLISDLAPLIGAGDSSTTQDEGDGDDKKDDKGVPRMLGSFIGLLAFIVIY